MTRAAARSATGAACVAAAAAVMCARAGAQSSRPAGISRTLVSPAAEGGALPAPSIGEAARTPWWAPVASAALPGGGQLALRQHRFVPYIAAESFGWAKFLSARRDARRQRRAYQQLALDVARSRFPPPWPVGDFEYYEHMLKYAESGEYDAVPGGAIDPETDTTTFNGVRWLEARRLFWGNPSAPPPPTSDAYQRAVRFYEANAVRSEYRWSWRDAWLEQNLYRQTIVRSNRAFRHSVDYLGVLIANHALSAVDAFVTIRVRSAELGRGGRVEGSLPLELPRRPR